MIIKKIKLFNDELELFSAAYPIGYVYKQYPGKKSPMEMWSDFSTWIELDYNGAFFRSNGGNSLSFNNHLIIETISGTTITFTTAHNLSVNCILYDSVHNESHIVTGTPSSNTVYVNEGFTNPDIEELIFSQIDLMKTHRHSMNHPHTASSSTWINSQSFYDYFDNIYYANGGGNWGLIWGYTTGYDTKTVLSSFFNPSVSTSTSVGDYNGNTSNYGDTETRDINMTVKLWKRIE